MTVKELVQHLLTLDMDKKIGMNETVQLSCRCCSERVFGTVHSIEDCGDYYEMYFE